MEAFANRLKKRARHLRRWARRQKTNAYRIYDRDLPDFPVALDRYGERFHLQFHGRGRAGERALDPNWRAGVREAVCAGLELKPEQLFCKDRSRPSGGEQYQKVDGRGEEFAVEEGGHLFLVNLTDYLDTGLFLDHRNTRQMVARESQGKRLLNLFCYTGAFTVHGARAGATATVSVDRSNTYLSWLERNLVLNQVDLAEHRLIRGDVMGLLEEPDRLQPPFDVVVVDPPSFSNQRFTGSVFDLKRDHVRLLQATLRLVSPGGVIYFSNHAKRFQLQTDAFPDCAVEEITRRTVPQDFRDRDFHRCWTLRT